MSAVTLYATISKLILQNDDLPSSSINEELHNSLINLQQILTCVICQNVLIEPYSPVCTSCEHHICKGCLKKKKKIKRNCSFCKGHPNYVINSELKSLLVCFQELCLFITSTKIYQQLLTQLSVSPYDNDSIENNIIKIVKNNLKNTVVNGNEEQHQYETNLDSVNSEAHSPSKHDPFDFDYFNTDINEMDTSVNSVTTSSVTDTATHLTVSTTSEKITGSFTCTSSIFKPILSSSTPKYKTETKLASANIPISTPFPSSTKGNSFILFDKRKNVPLDKSSTYSVSYGSGSKLTLKRQIPIDNSNQIFVSNDSSKKVKKNINDEENFAIDNILDSLSEPNVTREVSSEIDSINNPVKNDVSLKETIHGHLLDTDLFNDKEEILDGNTEDNFTESVLKDTSSKSLDINTLIDNPFSSDSFKELTSDLDFKQATRDTFMSSYLRVNENNIITRPTDDPLSLKSNLPKRYAKVKNDSCLVKQNSSVRYNLRPKIETPIHDSTYDSDADNLNDPLSLKRDLPMRYKFKGDSTRQSSNVRYNLRIMNTDPYGNHGYSSSLARRTIYPPTKKNTDDDHLSLKDDLDLLSKRSPSVRYSLRVPNKEAVTRATRKYCTSVKESPLVKNDIDYRFTDSHNMTKKYVKVRTDLIQNRGSRTSVEQSNNVSQLPEYGVGVQSFMSDPVFSNKLTRKKTVTFSLGNESPLKCRIRLTDVDSEIANDNQTADIQTPDTNLNNNTNLLHSEFSADNLLCNSDNMTSTLNHPDNTTILDNSVLQNVSARNGIQNTGIYDNNSKLQPSSSFNYGFQNSNQDNLLLKYQLMGNISENKNVQIPQMKNMQPVNKDNEMITFVKTHTQFQNHPQIERTILNVSDTNTKCTNVEPKSRSRNYRTGCRCGNATATPGKLTCCGQRCPCYIDSKACSNCKCRGCRNPHMVDGIKYTVPVQEMEMTHTENSDVS